MVPFRERHKGCGLLQSDTRGLDQRTTLIESRSSPEQVCPRLTHTGLTPLSTFYTYLTEQLCPRLAFDRTSLSMLDTGQNKVVHVLKLDKTRLSALDTGQNKVVHIGTGQNNVVHIGTGQNKVVHIGTGQNKVVHTGTGQNKAVYVGLWREQGCPLWALDRCTEV